MIFISVMDFCLTKSLVCDHETNFTHLMLEWASKSNCIQRKGTYVTLVSSMLTMCTHINHFYNGWMSSSQML